MARRANRGRKSQTVSIPAPVGGLNDKDSIANMPPTDALVLENWFPSTNSVDIRGGCAEFATGLSAIGETLMAYGGPTKKLFAASGGNIYDITLGGAVGAAVVSGKANGRWDHVNFGNAGANYLVAVNGTDLPMFWNGTTWQASGTGYATAITGVAATVFSQVSVWKTRLFFVEKNALKCWYLPTGAIGGLAAVLDFSGVAKLGGYIVATASITSSAGVTPDDYFVAITSEGECLVYRGTDPSSASTFALVGNYRIGRPIANGNDNQGGRFLAKYASDLVAITADGFTTIQAMFNADVVAQQRTINDKIINTVTNDVSSYKAYFGWNIKLAPIQNKLIINVPLSPDNTVARQYVMNTITGAWCKFTGWNATCFEVFNDALYAIIGTSVYSMDIQQTNDFVSSTSTGQLIQATAKTSFQYVGGRNAQKSYKMVRPLIIAAGPMVPVVGVNVDFRDDALTGTASVLPGNNAVWDTAKWDAGLWAAESILYANWLSVSGIGYCAAVKMIVQANNQFCRWQGFDIMYETGGLL